MRPPRPLSGRVLSRQGRREFAKFLRQNDKGRAFCFWYRLLKLRNIQAVENINHRVGAKRALALARAMAQEHLKLWPFEQVLKPVDAGYAQDCGVKQGVDNRESGNLRGLSPITQFVQSLRHPISADGIFFKLMKTLALGHARGKVVEQALLRWIQRANLFTLLNDRSAAKKVDRFFTFRAFFSPGCAALSGEPVFRNEPETKARR